ncbi:MAG TPA: FadR/GntR family transcriptional regulator [Galbitalea sp.]|jgi:DNA-binding FadR family transcriptional regulator|nr:FadR/GntR family transcriptional regulator [Galbitalea sp.]
MTDAKKIEFTNARLRPVERMSTASVVARQLLDELGKDQFVSGTRLPSEREMADTLGVGRSTLREAMSALDLLGIIEVRPGSGSYLKADSSQLLPQALKWGLALGQPENQELIEVREHLEVLAASLAAKRADDADIARLEVQVRAMKDAGTNVEAFVDADIAFHLETAIIARNSVLEGVLESIRALLEAWFDRTLRVEGTMSATLREHELVFDAIKNRDPEAAESRMKALMDAADLRLKRTL